MNGGMKGVAFVEADTEQWAIKTFMEQYAGQYFTIETVTKIGWKLLKMKPGTDSCVISRAGFLFHKTKNEESCFGLFFWNSKVFK